MEKMDLKEILESLHKINFPVNFVDPAPIVVPEDMINYNPEWYTKFNQRRELLLRGNFIEI